MKNVKFVKNSLKFKTEPKAGLLTVRVGVKKYRLPMEARLIAGEGHLFLSFPASSELYQIEDGALVSLPSEADGTKAYEELNVTRRRRRGKGKRAPIDLPDNLVSALKAIPDGYRLVFDLKTGEPRLAKKRERRKKNS